MGRRKPKNKNTKGAPTYWQSSDMNTRSFIMYREWILQLAMSRFRWEGLPETCDERYLELQLAMNGCATIARHPDLGIWVSTQTANQAPNIYDDPTKWKSVGNNGWNFQADPTCGVVVWDNPLRVPIWNNLEIWARRLADFDRTIDANLAHQKIPWVFSVPQEKIFDVTNALKQAAGGEPAIIGYKGIETIQGELMATPVDFKGQEMHMAKALLWNEIYTYLGIANVDQKTERMIEAEVSASNEGVSLRGLAYLQERRRACKYLNEVFDLDIHVYWNKDNESDNYNIMHNISDYAETMDVSMTLDEGEEDGTDRDIAGE